ncbi:lipid droplet-regulating VLDL assembly factor AUP1-like [Periplaneta americana]|uniref:lipid droplet-regulating VLDL assembly factor AUP1-like n=1 Tax=Periplaneta americana TaxID=6978 RepID=UPI0037E98848
MSNVEVKELFDENRYPSGWKALLLVLYTPVGLVLAGVRLLIAVQALLVALLLPQIPAVKRFVLRSLCVALGIVVKQENSTVRDENVKVLVANHISPCDHIAVHLVSGSVTPSVWELPGPLCWALGLKEFGLRQGREVLLTNIRSHFEKSTVPVLCHPEGSTTSGKVGLLKFSSWPFCLTDAIQPVAIQIWRPACSDVAASALATGIWADIFWFLFVPCTIFTLRYLPVVVKDGGESDSQFGERAAQLLAAELGIEMTQHTASDKVEYEKRYLLEQSQPVIARTSSTSELQRMARQVGEVLPYVPHDVIIRDLVRTRSVDVTISNILEGVVTYVPQMEASQSVGSVNTATEESKNIPSTSTATHTLTNNVQGSCLDTSSPSFARSAQERMLSFNERKARLIENARQRYIEKHGLKNVGFNC